MLPSYNLAPIHLGPLVMYPWGLFVSLGILAGFWLAYGFLKKRAGQEAEKIFNLSFGLILAGLISSRFFHVFFYEPRYFLAHPWEILKIWQGGLSSLGGILGAGAAAYFYLRKEKLNLFLWLDALAFGLPLGLAIGRLGCFLTHQHLGIKSNFFLSVVAPDGPRLEMSMIEAILLLVLFVYFVFKNRRLSMVGFYLRFFLIFYGLTRFCLDFLRASDLPGADARYFGLTPAQYVSIFFLIIGVVLFAIKKKTALRAV